LTKMIAYCGLVCSDCPAFLATRSDDDIARKKIAASWTEKFGHDFKPEDINCEGCKSEGKRLVGYCHVCPIRKCALARGVESCARCEEQPCEELLKMHAYSSEAKAAFEALKS